MATQTGSIDLKAAKKAHDDAEKVATNYVADITNGIMVHPEGDSTTGWKIADALELLKSGVTYIWAGLVNNIPKIQIGQSEGANVTITSDGISGRSDAGKVFAFNFNDEPLPIKATTTTKEVMPPRDLVVTLTDAILDANIKFTLRGKSLMTQSQTVINREGQTVSFTIGSATLSATIGAKVNGKQKVIFVWQGSTTGIRTAYITAEYYRDAGLAPSFAFGLMSDDEDVASGAYSFVEGLGSVSRGICAHAQNQGTIASSENQTAMGAFNVEDDANTYALIVGNGTDDITRSNAFAVTWDGNVELDLAGYTTSGSVDKDIYEALDAHGWTDCYET